MPVYFVFFGAFPDPDCETFADPDTFSARHFMSETLPSVSISWLFSDDEPAFTTSMRMSISLPYKKSRRGAGS